MVIIKVTPTWINMIGLSEAIQAHFANILTAMFPNYWFTPRYKQGLWNGKVPFYSLRSGGFSVQTGFLGLVKRELMSIGIEHTIENPYSFDIEMSDVELN